VSPERPSLPGGPGGPQVLPVAGQQLAALWRHCFGAALQCRTLLRHAQPTVGRIQVLVHTCTLQVGKSYHELSRRRTLFGGFEINLERAAGVAQTLPVGAIVSSVVQQEKQFDPVRNPNFSNTRNR